MFPLIQHVNAPSFKCSVGGSIVQRGSDNKTTHLSAPYMCVAPNVNYRLKVEQRANTIALYAHADVNDSVCASQVCPRLLCNLLCLPCMCADEVGAEIEVVHFRVCGIEIKRRVISQHAFLSISPYSALAFLIVLILKKAMCCPLCEEDGV